MPELSRRRRILVLAICCLSLFIFGVDSTIVNVALPSIQHDLHAPVSGLQWTVDAYTVVIASILILAGSTADRFGRRKVFQIGAKALDPATPLAIARTHRFRDFSTRKHYPGKHRIAVLVNGVERANRPLKLVALRTTTKARR